MKFDLNIAEQDRKEITLALKHLLANTYSLYLQTHNFHWNVTGPCFRQHHLMYEELYTELAVAVDDIAERIRTLGEAAPGTYKSFTQLSSIKEIEGVPEANKMLEILILSQQEVIKTCRQVLNLSQAADDESTAALASDRMRIHEKTIWMLSSSI